MPLRFKLLYRLDGVRWGMLSCKVYRQSSSGSSVCFLKSAMAAASGLSTVDFGFLGPVGASFV